MNVRALFGGGLMQLHGGLLMERAVSCLEKDPKQKKGSARVFFLSRDLNMTNRTHRALFFILIGVFAGACGGSDTTGPARVRLASTLTATACANGKFSLTANWQAVGTWQAVFTSETGTATSETSLVDANQTKTSTCIFLTKTMVYAILVPVTVSADADATPTLTLP
jgi:hypothetical protein